MTEKVSKEINGTEYEIWVDEKPGYRQVRVVNRDILDKKGHSYILTRDERERYEPDFLERLMGAEPDLLPSRSEHISDALNEAIAKNENRESREQKLRNEMHAVMDAAGEVWEDELE